MPTPGNAQQGGVLDVSRDLAIKGQVVSTGPRTTAGGVGYADGAGASVTQITTRSTAVTVNGLCGTITTDTTSLAAEAAAAFVVNNNCVQIGDVPVIAQRSGKIGAMSDVVVTAVANGSFTLAVMNNNPAGGTAETGPIIINFAIIKGTTV